MKQISGLFAVLAIFATSLAWSAPKIDPMLEEIAQEKNFRPVTVIATFEDKMPKVDFTENGSDFTSAREYMIENARVSQLATVLRLKDKTRTIRYETLPLNNSMIIHLNSNELKDLFEDENIKAIWADRPVYLFKPKTSRLSSKKAFTWGLKKIRVNELQRKDPAANGEGVNVGIIDTGIQADHPALAGRTVAFYDFNNESNTQPVDGNGHGTHVAGTIGGTDAGGTEIGVAPKVNFTIAKVFDARGRTTMSAITKSMDWVADPDKDPSTADAPRIVSNSWGGGNPSARMKPVDHPLCKAVQGWRNLGMVPVFAAGNSGSRSATVNLPGGCPSAIAIGATDSSDKIARFSSRGPARWKTGTFVKPEVSAPGVRVESAYPNNRYRSLSGTSMATPHVSGVVALMLQKNPDMTVDEVRTALINGTIDLGKSGPDNNYGHGRVDVMRALGKAK